MFNVNEVTLPMFGRNSNSSSNSNGSSSSRGDVPPGVLQLAKKFRVSEVALERNVDVDVGVDCDGVFHFTSEELGASQPRCDLTAGLALSPTCARKVLSVLSAVRDACDRTGSACQVSEGTLLGAAKLQDVLPWEVDSDFNVRADDFASLVSALEEDKSLSVKTSESFYLKEKKEIFSIFFNAMNLTVKLPKCVTGGCEGGEATIRVGTWKVDLTGQRKLMRGEKETK